MAQVQQVKFVDDLDGSVAEKTSEFGIDGKFYEIDLSPANRERLVSILAPFMGVARRAGTLARKTHQSRDRHGVQYQRDREKSQAIRDWANGNGFSVSLKGRIPRLVMDAYKAHEREQNRLPVMPADERREALAPAAEGGSNTGGNKALPAEEKSADVLPFPVAEPEPKPKPTDNDIMIWWLANHTNSKAKRVTPLMRGKYAKAHE